MTAVDANSPEIQAAFNQALQWLNMKSNSLKPFTLGEIYSAKKEENGDISFDCNLRMFDNDHHFNLTVNPSENSPEALKYHKQLN